MIYGGSSHSRGLYIQQFGFTIKSVEYLYPEDVCLLLEKHAVELNNCESEEILQVFGRDLDDRIASVFVISTKSN